MPSDVPARERGFTLLEVLVAFLIAALALTALFNGALGGLRAARVASQYQEAVARARSHMAALGTDGQLSPQDANGDDGGGFRWHVRVVPVATAAPPATEAASVGQVQPATVLYAVSVVITWKDGEGGREVRLDSQRLGTSTRRGN